MQVLQKGKAVTRHHEPINLHGRTIYQDINAFLLVPGTIQGVVFRIDDVTEYVKLQELTLQSAKLASLGGLAAGVAHEINNPLAAMMQSAQMIQHSLDTEDVATRERLHEAGMNVEALGAYLKERHFYEYVTGIRESGGRAAKIVTDLLAFSRKNNSTITSTDLNNLIQKTVTLAATDYNLSNHYDFRNIRVDYLLDEDLPLVNCDPQQIQQVLLNLLSNASQALVAKSKSDSQFQPLIIVSTTTESKAVRLVVEDNGEGLDPLTLEHIFEPFYTTKDVGIGTGLGLWLSWSIVVERHHGQMWAENRMGAGARFIIQLPV
jgi:polar amino acid transport system substrate-binding protein